MPAMEKNLEAFIANVMAADKEADENVPPLKVEELEEASLDKMEFDDGVVTSGDWEHLSKKLENVLAVSIVDCKLQKIEAPKEKSPIEVLDISFNPEVEDLSFLEQFPKLVSLTMHGLSKFGSGPNLDKLVLLKKLPNLRVLECSDDMLFGKKEQSEFRSAVFELLPDLYALNGHDAEGAPLDDLEEDDIFDSEFLEEEDLDDEESVESGAEEGPDAKRAKTDE